MLRIVEGGQRLGREAQAHIEGLGRCDSLLDGGNGAREGRAAFLPRLGGVDVQAVGKVPEIAGQGWITARTEYRLDPTDPFPTGYRVGDLW